MSWKRCEATLNRGRGRCRYRATRSVLALDGEFELCGLHTRTWPNTLADEPLEGSLDCKSCGKPLVRRKGEKPANFAKRITCGGRCGKALPRGGDDRLRWIAEDRGYVTPCWIWQRSFDVHGYGQLTIGNRLQKAHRVSYEMFEGPIPDGLHIDHLCRVRACINPDHLEPVTKAENERRALEFRRSQATCKNGHPWDENAYINPKGHRNCRACRRESLRRFRAAKAAV